MVSSGADERRPARRRACTEAVRKVVARADPHGHERPDPGGQPSGEPADRGRGEGRPGNGGGDECRGTDSGGPGGAGPSGAGSGGAGSGGTGRSGAAPAKGGDGSGGPAGGGHSGSGQGNGGGSAPPGGRDAARRLHAVMELAKALATAHTLMDVVRISARQARAAMDAALASISVWERDSGHLRVLVNDGDLADGEEALPHAETYAVTDFPEIIAPATWPTAWSNTVDERDSAHERVVALRRRGRHGCMVAPIMVDGRVWGELYLARHADQPRFDAVDAEFAAVLAAQISAGLAQAEHYQRIEKLAFTDPLTGLANRRAIDARLDAAITRHYREGIVVSLIVCDVNGLKRLNDERGHDVGDRLLERFADQLSACSAMLPGSMAARLGGDEFCVLVEGFTPDEVVAVAEELCRRALRMHDGEGVACGVASTGDPVGPVTSADRLFRLADAAQYRARVAGRSTRWWPGAGSRRIPRSRSRSATMRSCPPIPRLRARRTATAAGFAARCTTPSRGACSPRCWARSTSGCPAGCTARTPSVGWRSSRTRSPACSTASRGGSRTCPRTGTRCGPCGIPSTA